MIVDGVVAASQEIAKQNAAKKNVSKITNGQNKHSQRTIWTGSLEKATIGDLTPDPQGVRAKAAMVCSCHAVHHCQAL